MKHKRIVIAGGAGFVGKGLVEEWGANNFIVVLTRQRPAPLADGNTFFMQNNNREINWRGEKSFESLFCLLLHQIV